MALSFMLNDWEVFCQILAVEETKSCGIDLENKIKKMEDNSLKTRQFSYLICALFVKGLT